MNELLIISASLFVMLLAEGAALIVTMRHSRDTRARLNALETIVWQVKPSDLEDLPDQFAELRRKLDELQLEFENHEHQVPATIDHFTVTRRQP